MRRPAIALSLLFPILGCAQPAPLEVKDAWARDSVGRTANAALFMTISSGTPDRLVGASSPIAQKTDLMTMTSGNGAMAMKYIEEIPIPAGKTVSLGPSGFHVWLAGLKQPLRAGETFPLFLQFEKAGRRRVTVSVIKPAAAPPMSGMRM